MKRGPGNTKLKTIASIFNRNKRLAIHTAENGEQWISNGIAAYSLRGMPHVTPEIVLRIFDVPPDKHNKWICHQGELPAAVDFSDFAAGESDIMPLKIYVEWFGQKYWLFPDGQRIYSINEDYIKPLLDEHEYLTYHKRETEGGGFALACKVGLEIRAIIAPVMLYNDGDFVEEIRRAAKLYGMMILEDVANAAYEIFGTTVEAAKEADRDADESEDLDGQINLQDTEK